MSRDFKVTLAIVLLSIFLAVRTTFHIPYLFYYFGILFFLELATNLIHNESLHRSSSLLWIYDDALFVYLYVASFIFLLLIVTDFFLSFFFIIIYLNVKCSLWDGVASFELYN